MLTILLLATLSLTSPAQRDSTASGLWYSVAGEGPTLVFLHGSNLDSRSWGQLPDALAKEFRVVRMDLRSHGRSRDASGPFSWVSDVIAVLDAVGAERATLIGHSLGAQIAIDAAISHPNRVSRLIVIGPAISGLPMKKPPAGFEGMVAALRRGDLTGAGVALSRMPVMTLYRDTTRQPDARTIVMENVRLFRADPSW
jgi:pimeloyl-ACP methyl ester carboxylesterase